MSGETAKVILDLCQALEKHLNKQPYHTKTSDDLAWEAGCKWLGNNAATPPGYEMDRGDAKTDAEFIAHSRQDIPDLLAHIAELEAQLSQPQDVVSRESRQATQAHP